MSAVRSAAPVVVAALYLVLLFVGGSVDPAGSRPPLVRELPSLDKLLHALAFGGFVPVLARALAELGETHWRRRLLLAALGSSLAGGLLELYQAALPHRSAEWLDLVADSVGASVALVIGWVVIRRRERRAERPATAAAQ